MVTPAPAQKSQLLEYLWRELRLGRRAIQYLLEHGPHWKRLWQESVIQPFRIRSYLPEKWLSQFPNNPSTLKQSQAPNPYFTLADHQYPMALRELHDPPVVIYHSDSKLEFLASIPRIAVVGTRRASDYAAEQTHKIVQQMAPYGACVVSGMAWGIDAVAHRQALAVGLPTLGILGTPLERPHPRSQTALFLEMKRRGNLWTEIYSGAAAGSFRFPERNRLIAAMSHAVIVVEAPEKSGALITAGQALDLGREVFVIPGPLRAPGNEGGHRLIQEGARLLTHAREIFSHLGVHDTTKKIPDNPSPGGQSTSQLADPIQLQILRHLKRGPQHIDKIIHISQKPAPQVLAALTQMTLSEWIQELKGGVYKLI